MLNTETNDKIDHTKRYRGYRDLGPSHCQQVCERVQTLQRRFWQFILKGNIHLPYGPTTLLLRINPRLMKNMCMTVLQFYL